MIEPGSPVSLVFYVNGLPVAVAAQVEEAEPLRLSSKDRGTSKLESGKRALLILQSGSQFAKAEAQIIRCDPCEDGWQIEVGQFGWEEVDRRRYPRHAVRLPVIVKAVLDHEGDAELKYVHGEAVDLSLGGAWVKASDELASGSLVEFRAELRPGEHIRALAVVAWIRDDEGVGLEFVDFLGGSRYYLHTFLSKAA